MIDWTNLPKSDLHLQHETLFNLPQHEQNSIYTHKQPPKNGLNLIRVHTKLRPNISPRLPLPDAYYLVRVWKQEAYFQRGAIFFPQNGIELSVEIKHFDPDSHTLWLETDSHYVARLEFGDFNHETLSQVARVKEYWDFSS